MIPLMGLYLVIQPLRAAPPVEEPPPLTSITTAMERVRDLHAPVPEPGPIDWLSMHDEPGQSRQHHDRFRPIHSVDKPKLLDCIIAKFTNDVFQYGRGQNGSCEKESIQTVH